VPANRSRTMQWRRCLQQIHERSGAIEIAVAHADHASPSRSHLVWRVRIIGLNENEIIVEQPAALGQVIRFRTDIAIVAVITVGQNRWMFSTTNLGLTEPKTRAGKRVPGGMRLRMPTSVQRCQRRNHYRIQTASLHFPAADLWPLLDPKSVVLAERANELDFQRMDGGLDLDADATPTPDSPEIMPEVGPRLDALMLNLGGGGMGLRIPPEHAQVLSRHKLFFLRVALAPELRTPICASAKLAHTHMLSDHHIYAGMAFDFSFNAGHQRYLVEQISRYISEQQRMQLQGNADAAAAAEEKSRRSA